MKCAVGASLPAGIVTGRAARPDVHKFRGEPGDWIVMVTDGILCGREDQWLRDVVTQYTGSSPSELAQRILRESQTLCQGEDDGTVLAARLDRSQEKRPSKRQKTALSAQACQNLRRKGCGLF